MPKNTVLQLYFASYYFTKVIFSRQRTSAQAILALSPTNMTMPSPLLHLIFMNHFCSCNKAKSNSNGIGETQRRRLVSNYNWSRIHAQTSHFLEDENTDALSGIPWLVRTWPRNVPTQAKKKENHRKGRRHNYSY